MITAVDSSVLIQSLIAAHARTQADRLAAIDRGYLRRWFPDLKLFADGEGD